MKFEWDPNKARANSIKHGISFKEAISAFEDEMFLTEDDYFHSTFKEKRYRLIGLMHRKARRKKPWLVVVSYTVPAANVYRIISARPGSEYERNFYERNRSL
jgi:uncharacterized protein